MMGVKMRERVAIDHGSVFHGALHIDHKCEGRDSLKKEGRRLELKSLQMCACCRRSVILLEFCSISTNKFGLEFLKR